MRTAINKDKIAKLELLEPINNDDFFRDYWLIVFKTEEEVIFNSIQYETELLATTAFDQMIIDYDMVDIPTPETPPEE